MILLKFFTHTHKHTHTHYMEGMDQVKLFLLINTVTFAIIVTAQSQPSFLFFSFFLPFFFFFFRKWLDMILQALENTRNTLNTLNRLLNPTPSVSDILVLGRSLNIVISNKLVQKYIWPMNNWGIRAFSVAQMVRNPPAMQKTWFDPWFGKISWRRAWQPNPVFLLGKPPGQRSLKNCSLWGCKESDITD